jgi:hypothetical protein
LNTLISKGRIAIPTKVVAAAFVALYATVCSLLTDVASAARDSSDPSTSVEWSTPPPPAVDANQGISLPLGLIRPVHARLRTNAIALLRLHSTVPLTQAHAQQLAGVDNPERVLSDSIQELNSTLQTFELYPTIKNTVGDNVEADEIKRQEEQRKYDMEHLRLKINTLTTWKNKLKPYLVRSIEVGPYTAVGASLHEKTLLVVAGAVGGPPARERRSAIVVYLPLEPKQVYTAVSHMR